MMNRIQRFSCRGIIVAFILLNFILIAAQSPKLSLALSGGTWRGWVSYDESYAEPYQKWQPFGAANLRADFPISDKVVFSPEVGLEFHKMAYDYGRSKDRRELHANLGLFYSKISPGLALKPAPNFSIRLALTLLISSGAYGSYQVETYVHQVGPVVTGDYNDHFSRIRNWGTWGPEINVGYDFGLPNGGTIGPSIAVFVSQGKVFKSDLDTPYNPHIFRMNAAIAYSFPTKTKHE